MENKEQNTYITKFGEKIAHLQEQIMLLSLQLAQRLEAERQKPIKTSICPGDGYYLLKEGDEIHSDGTTPLDQLMPITGSNFGWHDVFKQPNWKLTNTHKDYVYRRKIPIPNGWERTTFNDCEVGNRYFINGLWSEITESEPFPSTAFFIRPIKPAIPPVPVPEGYELITDKKEEIKVGYMVSYEVDSVFCNWVVIPEYSFPFLHPNQVKDIFYCKPKPTPPEGYELLPDKTPILPCDRIWNKQYKDWFMPEQSQRNQWVQWLTVCRPIAIKKESTHPTPPPGYKLLTIDENTIRQEGDIYWDESKRAWASMEKPFATFGAYYSKDPFLASFYCRPLKKVFNPDWWKRGNHSLDEDGLFCKNYSSTRKMDRGRVFETETAALGYFTWEKKNAGRLRALQIIEDRIAELNDGWKPDWSKYDPPKFMFSLLSNICIDYNYKARQTSDSLYFKSKEIGEQLISEFGEDFIKQALGF